MYSKLSFVFWCLIALFIMIPVTNTVVQSFVSSNGTLEQTFNASNPQSWNATGHILTEEGVQRIGLTPLEQAVTQLYVPAMIIFFIIIILYVISRWTQNRHRGGQ